LDDKEEKEIELVGIKDVELSLEVVKLVSTIVDADVD
jgi:hypothetical protein